MPKVKISFSNYYIRNGFAYLIVLLLGMIPLASESRIHTVKDYLLTIAYYTFAFSFVVFHNKVLFDKILLKRRILVYILCLVGSYFLFYYVSKIITDQWGVPASHGRVLFIFLGDIALGVSIFLTTRYILERKEYYQTSLLKREVELQQLKSQLNPHFLFNALNNIYSYTLHNNKHGNDLILKLSELMRFILDSSEKETITVANEINFIENYITFEKERLGERCTVNYSKNILFENREIAPLILFPFVENAFKYGTDSIQKTSVEIVLFDRADMLKMVVKNSVVNRNQPSTKKGIPNAIRRLELLYQDRYELLIETTDELFIVELTLRYDKNKSADS